MARITKADLCRKTSGKDQNKKHARDAIRTHEPLRDWILSPAPLAELGYPRALYN